MSRVTKDDLLRLLTHAINDVRQAEATLPDDVHERTWCAHVACRLARAQELHDWNVDVEYNRQGTVPKRNSHGACVLPDIIIHRRGTTENLLAIEAKRLHGALAADLAKLHELATGERQYAYVAAIAFDGTAPHVWTRDEARKLGVDGMIAAMNPRQSSRSRRVQQRLIEEE